jgi:hypothetical protein
MQGTLRPRRILCCREIQHTLRDSSKQLIWDKIKELGLDEFYTSVEQEIRGKNGTVFAGLRTHSTGRRVNNRDTRTPLKGGCPRPSGWSCREIYECPALSGLSASQT